VKTLDVLIANHYRGPTVRPGYDLADLAWLRKNRLYLDDANEVWVGALADTLKVMDACEKRGLNADATRQFGAYYALVNENPAKPDEWNWDPDQRLTEVVVLSRLVFPTALGFEYAARLQLKDDGQLLRIVPLGDHRRAYTPETREWLTRDEWQQVKNLRQTWRQAKANACERLHKSLWYRENVAREYYLDIRWPLLITVLECLIGLWARDDAQDRPRLPGRRVQFVNGMKKLGEACDFAVTDQELDAAWERRSNLVHGQGWPNASLPASSPPSDPLYRSLEHAINAALRKLILDPSFRQHFETDASLLQWLGYSG